MSTKQKCHSGKILNLLFIIFSSYLNFFHFITFSTFRFLLQDYKAQLWQATSHTYNQYNKNMLF